MKQHISGIFKPTHWEETPYLEMDGGGKLTRVHMVATIAADDMQAEMDSQMLLAYTPDGTGLGVSIERVVGTLNGRQGSFVMQGTGSFEGHAAETTWTIVPGSGTDELRGIRGGGGFPMQASPDGVRFTLDYEIDA